MVRRAPAVVLPTGPKVWRRYYRPVKGLFRALLRARRTVRRRWFLLRVRAVAAVNGAEIALDVAREVELGRGVRVQVQPGTRNSMTIGPKCRLLDDVLIRFRGGRLRLAERVEIRRGTVLDLAGAFTCEGRNKLGYYNVVHCTEAITLELYACMNEFVSLIDSTHTHTGPHEHFYENLRSAPIRIGRNSWVCNKSVVLMGVTVGHNAVIASNSVVSKDVPDATVASGVPARIVAPRAVSGPAERLFGEATVGADYR